MRALKATTAIGGGIGRDVGRIAGLRSDGGRGMIVAVRARQGEGVQGEDSIVPVEALVREVDSTVLGPVPVPKGERVPEEDFLVRLTRDVLRVDFLVAMAEGAGRIRIAVLHVNTCRA